jgi:hypothetical protein
MESVLMTVVPLLMFLTWLGLIVYLIVLATRLVTAVEQIARAVGQRPPDRALP